MKTACQISAPVANALLVVVFFLPTNSLCEELKREDFFERLPGCSDLVVNPGNAPCLISRENKFTFDKPIGWGAAYARQKCDFTHAKALGIGSRAKKWVLSNCGGHDYKLDSELACHKFDNLNLTQQRQLGGKVWYFDMQITCLQGKK